jgi:hypothetical protein
MLAWIVCKGAESCHTRHLVWKSGHQGWGASSKSQKHHLLLENFEEAQNHSLLTIFF